MFLVMLSLGVILPHLAYYAEELGASAAQIGFLISIYSAMKLIFAPVWGRLSDLLLDCRSQPCRGICLSILSVTTDWPTIEILGGVIMKLNQA